MSFRTALKILLLLLSIIGSTADFTIDGVPYSDTYIVGSGQPLTVTCGLDAGSIAWASNVTGPIPSGVHSFQGVNITNNANGDLVFDTFIRGISGVYTCSDGILSAAILLTTSNPSLNILSQQPVKIYDGAAQFQLSMSSYYIQDGVFQPTPIKNITIHYYNTALQQNISTTFVMTQQGACRKTCDNSQLVVSVMDSLLPSGTIFYIRVDNGNGFPIEMPFTITRIALYITPLATEIIALAGDNVTIDCSPSDPVINVNITFVSLQTTDQQLVSNKGLYTLFSVTGSNSGMYECSGYASKSMIFTNDFMSSEMVILTVLPDPVAIEFNGQIIVNVSVINTPHVNTTSLTCIGTKGNSKLQWMTFNKTINSYLRNAYLTINGNSDGVDVNDSQLTIRNSANSTTLIIGNVNRYSQSFLYCISQESGIKAFTLVTQANPFVITHPDLPSDAALGQNFEMMFVVGIDSDGTKNFIQATGSSTVELMFSFNSTVLYQTAYESPFDNLPFTVKYQVPISTESEGYYTLAINIIELRKTARITTVLMVIVPSVNITTSPINVLQSTSVTLSCVPSDQRSPVVWEYFNDTAGMYEGILNISAYSFGYNGHSITFYTLLMPASIQKLNLPSLPDPSLGLIKPIPSLQPSVSYVHTQGSLMFRCSLVNGSTEKVFFKTIQLNTLRDFIQMAATFNDGSQVSLFNDTTMNISPDLQLTSLNCLILNELGSPVFTTNNSFISALLQPEEVVHMLPLGINILRTPVSISVNVSVPNPAYIEGYHICSRNNGEAFVVRVTADNPFITNEGSPITTLPLGGIGVLYFQLAASCTNGLTNLAFYEPSSVKATLQTFGSGMNVTTSLSQNSSGLSFVPYVVGPTTIVLYINPVKTINAGVYTVALASAMTANVTLNITVPKLSVAQSVISVYQGNATVISCTPNQFGVQIQWTFLSTNTVLATGYQYTYTINATTPLDEGMYVCSVFGDNVNTVEAQAVYVKVIAVCSVTYGAGVIWNVAYENKTVLMPCNVADTKFSNVTQMSRQCLPSGQWGAVDFTTCTLRSGVSRPFTMYWSSLVDESSLNDLNSVRNSTPGINITFNLFNISSLFGIFSQFGSSLFSIMISANLNDQQYIEYYPRLKRLAVPSTSLSYAVIWPSDPCSCKSSQGNKFYLCSNVQSSPCNCKNSTYCQCLPPFAGDGELCTIDSDLDGVPDTPLNCTGYTYCMKDNCPYIYNPPINGVQRDVCHGMLKDGCSPVNDIVWGLQWPGTALNSTYVLPCPQGGIDYVAGTAYRFCNSTGDWGLTDVTQCESYTIRYLAQQISSPSLDSVQAFGIVNSLFLETQPIPISILPLDLRDSVNILSTMLTLLNTNLQQGGGTDVLNTMIILDVINNLLNETNVDGWQILQTVDPSAASPHLLKTSELYGLYLASAINTTSSITLSRSSIVLQASKVQITPNQADIKFPDGNGDLFINATFSASDASIIIPGALLLERGNNVSSIPVANMIIKNIIAFLPLNGYIVRQVHSLVLSSQVAVEDGGFGSLVLQKRPAIISFRINNPSNLTSKYQCSFWKFSNSSWSSEGMLPPSSNGSFVQCHSTHLTSFAVLLAVETFPDSKALTIISYIGCGISMACLLATIVFFLAFRKQLLEKLHNFIHLNLAIALFLAFATFVAGVETAKNNIAACKAVAALLQYFWLSAFCWMMCEGVMLYLMLVVVFSTLQKKWWFFFLLGWVPALFFVVIGLAVRSDYYVVRNDNKIISYCWLSTEKGTIWAFAAPVVLILLVNALFLIMVLVVLFKKGRAKSTDVKINKDNKTVVLSLLKATVILLPILGCTWIFGLLSVNQYTLVFTWLFTILNSLQGLFIFICYVLRDERMWSRIVKKYKDLSSSYHSDQTKLKDAASQHSKTKVKVYTDLKSSGKVALESGKPDKYSEVQLNMSMVDSSQFTNTEQADMLY